MADVLGLAAEPEVHHGWENNAGAALVASADPRLNALLSNQFRHTREHDQLDLFIDSAQTVVVNALVDALFERDAGKAHQALERLVRIDRDHGQRFYASKLISALEAPVPEGFGRGLEWLERMEREWVPAAAALLGVRRRDFLAPLWRDIARALGPVPFDPSRPERHATRAYREGLDWGRLRQSVLAVHGLRERAGSARAACRGPLEAARRCQRHRVVVPPVPPCPRGVRTVNRSGGLSGLGAPDRMARRLGAGIRARDAPPPEWFGCGSDTEHSPNA